MIELVGLILLFFVGEAILEGGEKIEELGMLIFAALIVLVGGVCLVFW